MSLAAAHESSFYSSDSDSDCDFPSFPNPTHITGPAPQRQRRSVNKRVQAAAAAAGDLEEARRLDANTIATQRLQLISRAIAGGSPSPAAAAKIVQRRNLKADKPYGTRRMVKERKHKVAIVGSGNW